jgi:hypothetical protein
MTGHDDEASHAEAFEAGTDDFVVKPTGMSELKRRLAAATRNQRAYVDIRVAKEAADRRMAYGSEASALLAHDLNNGLAVSLSNLQYLREVLTLDSDQGDALETTVRSLRRMSILVANFVDIARFEDAAVKPKVAPTQVQQVLQSVLEVSASSLARGATIQAMPRGIAIRVERSWSPRRAGMMRIVWRSQSPTPDRRSRTRSDRSCSASTCAAAAVSAGWGCIFAGWWPKRMEEGSTMKPRRSGRGSPCACRAAPEPRRAARVGEG